MRTAASPSLRAGALAVLALLLTLGTVLLVDPEPGPAVLGISLAVSLSRSQLERDLRGRLEAGAILPVIGLATAGLALLLRTAPWIGAAVFVAGMTGSILLRIPGGLWRRIGALVALPFVTLLIAPPAGSTRFGPVGHAIVPLIVGVIAWAWVTVVQLAAGRLGLLRIPPTAPEPAPRRSSYHPSPSVRFAIQMAVSLSAAFVVGYLVFPERWAWIVLTALVVAVGQRGRADAVHKAVHRLLGSTLGTIVALLPVAALDRAPGAAIAVAVAAVCAGVLLRDRGYAWWALAVTLALAIVQQLGGAPPLLLAQREEEILIGAVIAVLPALLLLPVRSADTARARIAEVLRALQDQLADPTPATAGRLDRALTELRVATRPFAERTRLSRGRAGGAARWVALTEQLAALGRGGGSPEARRALGEARRTLREPDLLAPALERARDTLRDGDGNAPDAATLR